MLHHKTTTQISWALTTCVFFDSVMPFPDVAQTFEYCFYYYHYYFYYFFPSTSAVDEFATAIIPLRSMHSLY